MVLFRSMKLRQQRAGWCLTCQTEQLWPTSFTHCRCTSHMHARTHMHTHSLEGLRGGGDISTASWLLNTLVEHVMCAELWWVTLNTTRIWKWLIVWMFMKHSHYCDPLSFCMYFGTILIPQFSICFNTSYIKTLRLSGRACTFGIGTI